ncbi:hypothetical protein [Catellatospora sichuanensis]|uniref:hypothetical protein n=1 Tax=Catellatospora sichuanensis TaxID=1969805 RepID=UPI0011823EA4|nr:hypothetical protein [Catellatospora sichuanensis]
MRSEKSVLGRVAIWLGVAGLALLIISFGDRVTAEIDGQHGRLYLLITGLFILTWAVVSVVGAVIIRELREHELTRRLLRSGEAE